MHIVIKNLLIIFRNKDCIAPIRESYTTTTYRALHRNQRGVFFIKQLYFLSYQSEIWQVVKIVPLIFVRFSPIRK